MSLFDVYPLYDITPVRGNGVWLYDGDGNSYLDLYGGHAVISIGHSHPVFVAALQEQMQKLVFYSNSVKNPLQQKLAALLSDLSECADYQLFLCNSGAEANENALKLASLYNNRKKVIAFKNGFHGRTSAAVAATDNPKIQAPLNLQHQVALLPLNDVESLEKELLKGDACAVILECIQGVGGLDSITPQFASTLQELCAKTGTPLICDEVQSGYGRSGAFFAFQHFGLQPDIISMAKGMGNGFPIGGILIHSKIKAQYGQLGTTFGGNHLACAAAIAVLEVIKAENLIENAKIMGDFAQKQISILPRVKRLKGRGLMLGLEFGFEVAELRKKLIFEKGIFSGGSNNKNLLRILPPLNINAEHLDQFFTALQNVLEEPKLALNLGNSSKK